MRAKEKLSACQAGACGPRKNAAQRVFETACELFYRRGVRAVGVDEICNEAGVTKPSLYRSFASKDDLVAACLVHYSEECWEQLDVAIAAAGDDPRDQLRAFIGHYAKQMKNPEFRGCPMSNTAVEFPDSGHPGRPILEDSKIALRQRLVDMTRRMPVRDPETLADGLMLLIEGAYSVHQIFGRQGPAQAMVESADALIAAYTKAPQRA